MANPEEVKEAISALPIEEGDRQKIYEQIDELAVLIQELEPIEYLKLPKVQEEVRRIMAYALERQKYLEGRSAARKWIGRMLPFYGAGLGAFAATVPWSPEQFDTTYLERLAGQPSGHIILTFLAISVLWHFMRKGVDQQSQEDIDAKVFDALAGELDRERK